MTLKHNKKKNTTLGFVYSMEDAENNDRRCCLYYYDLSLIRDKKDFFGHYKKNEVPDDWRIFPQSAIKPIEFIIFNLDDGSSILTMIVKSYKRETGETGEINLINTGLALEIEDLQGDGDNKFVVTANVNETNRQRFIIQPVEDFYTLLSKDNNAHLIFDYVENNLGQYFIEQSRSTISPKHKFKLVHLKKHPLPTLPKITDAPRPIRMTGFEPTPTMTEVSVTSYTLLPYFCVGDTLLASTRITDTPYYLMVKEEYWEQNYRHEFVEGLTEQKIMYEVGMSELNVTNMEETTNMSLKSDLGFSFKGLTATISGQITNELKVNQSTSTTRASSSKVEYTIKNESGKRCVIAGWIHVTRFKLYRSNNNSNIQVQIGKDWVLKSNREFFQDKYPSSTE